LHPVFLAAAALVQFLLGNGAYAVRLPAPRWLAVGGARHR
jgi:hypothetical protein